MFSGKQSSRMTMSLIYLLVLLTYSQSGFTDEKMNKDKLSAIKSMNAVSKRVNSSLQGIFNEKKLNYPPTTVLIQVFKQEKKLILWASNANNALLTKVKTYNICAIDTDAGPKITDGDGKTPEGFYRVVNYQPYSSFGIKMEQKDYPQYKTKTVAVSMGIDYPNLLDIYREKPRISNKKFKEISHWHKHNKKLDSNNWNAALPWQLRGSSVGEDIFLHGNCMSIGCVSFNDNDFLEIFSLSDPRQKGEIQVQIYPCNFMNEQCKTQLNKLSESNQKLRSFWGSLEKGLSMFNQSKRPLKVSVNQKELIYSFN
jgi:murein L,D-transpeptidase YafK